MRFISCGIPLLLFVPLTVDSSESAYTTTEVARGGTIRGTVTWVGNQVAPRRTRFESIRIRLSAVRSSCLKPLL